MTIHEIKNNPYATDIAGEILATLIARETYDVRELVHERQLIYGLTGTEDEQNNVFLKVFNQYAPVLKQENETIGERHKLGV